MKYCNKAPLRTGVFVCLEKVYCEYKKRIALKKGVDEYKLCGK